MSDQDTIASDDDVPERFAVDFTGQSLLGIYQVERKLADGGMGSVYLAEDTNLGRPVVVKVPHARFLGESGFRARFKREIKELVRLEHPGIVRILAQGEQDQVPYFVLQYLAGNSLEAQLRAADGPMSTDDCLPWLRTVAKTLDFIHARGVVHRDVKPDNILFDEEGHVFLSDFGVVKALDQDDVATTAVGSGVGSPKYMAPEQGIGRPIAGNADQYALACTVYEALAGKPPYEASTAVELIMKKDREDPPDLGACVPGLPAGAAAAVMRALSRNPADRFDSCTAFADAFVAGLAPPDLTPASGTQLMTADIDQVPVGRHLRISVVALVFGAVVLAGLAFWFGWFGGGQAEHDRNAAVENGTEDRPDDDLRLVKRGAKPWVKLRYRPQVGLREKMTMVITETRSQVRNGRALPTRAVPPTTLVASITVEAIEPNGDMAFRWEVLDCHMDLPKDPEPRRAGFGRISAGGGLPTNKQLEALRGAGTTNRISARGVPLDTAWSALEELPPAVRMLVMRLAMGIRQVTALFPEEEVGVGAIWDVSKNTTMMGGLRISSTTSYEVLAIEGDTVRLKATVAMLAPKQEVGRGEDTGVLHRFFSEGGGEIQVDLRHITPTSMDVSTRLEIARGGTEDGQTVTEELKTESAVSLTRE
jgi:serine/threonine-protein kinase